MSKFLKNLNYRMVQEENKRQKRSVGVTSGEVSFTEFMRYDDVSKTLIYVSGIVLPLGYILFTSIYFI